MIRFRIRLSTVMYAVLLTACNLALCRFLYCYYCYGENAFYMSGLNGLLNFLPLAITPQVGLVAAIRRRAARRAFWVGFLAGAAVVLASRIWGELHPPEIDTQSVMIRVAELEASLTAMETRVAEEEVGVEMPSPAPTTTRLRVIYTSRITHLWDSYWRLFDGYVDEHVNQPLGELLARHANTTGPPASPVSGGAVPSCLQAVTVCEVVLFLVLPQLLVACAGGLVIRQSSIDG